eukprot:1141821-Pelagomonas_calceolata.AAC.1
MQQHMEAMHLGVADMQASRKSLDSGMLQGLGQLPATKGRSARATRRSIREQGRAPAGGHGGRASEAGKKLDLSSHACQKTDQLEPPSPVVLVSEILGSPKRTPQACSCHDVLSVSAAYHKRREAAVFNMVALADEGHRPPPACLQCARVTGNGAQQLQHLHPAFMQQTLKHL